MGTLDEQRRRKIMEYHGPVSYTHLDVYKRQVFIDPEHRCINWLSLQKIGVQFDPNETTYNYISGIAFEGISHMTKMNMRFSPNLNCIVGGRGTGKSTIVDAIKMCIRDSMRTFVGKDSA